jgi:hypothetical protein
VWNVKINATPLLAVDGQPVVGLVVHDVGLVLEVHHLSLVDPPRSEDHGLLLADDRDVRLVALHVQTYGLGDERAIEGDDRRVHLDDELVAAVRHAAVSQRTI